MLETPVIFLDPLLIVTLRIKPGTGYQTTE